MANPLSKLVAVQKAIEKNCEIHFGIRSGLLSDDLIEAVISDICNKYGTLSIKDLDFAFDNYAEERKDWKMITKKDILNPVIKWLQWRERIRIDYEKHQNEINKEAESEQKRKEFEIESLELYSQSLKVNEWKGDIFHASSIAKKYLADKFSQDVKAELWEQAQREYRTAKIQAEEQAKDPTFQPTPEMMGVSALRIFSSLIVKKAVIQNITIQ